MLPELAKEHISQLSDVDLVEYILTGTPLYLPEAVEYARAELERRRVDDAQIDQLCEVAEQRISIAEAAAVEQALRPLGTAGRTGAFLIGMLGGWHVLVHLV